MRFEMGISLTDLHGKVANDDGLERIKVYPRLSSIEDTDKLLQYYKDNAHQHVSVRRHDWIEHHAAKGQFLVFETEDGEILASSATYDYVIEGDSEAEPSYYEIGSTNFSDKGKGYGLYPFVIASQCLDAFLRNPPKKNFLADVYDSSPVGRDMLVPKVGWQPEEVEPEVWDKFESTKSDEHTNQEPMTWYASKSNSLPFQARLVLEELKKTEIVHKNGKQALEIDFGLFPLANEYYPALQKLAYGDFGQWLENSDPIDLEHASAALWSELRPGFNQNPGF